MNYRKAIVKDINQLSRMRWEFQTEDKDEKSVWPEEDFIKSCSNFYNKIINSSNWLFWIAESNNEIIAHVSLYIIDNIPTPSRLINKWGYLTNTYTKKKYRNRGVGSKLVKHIIDDAKTIGIETIIAWPSDKSLAFYERAGFNNINDIMEFRVEKK